MKIPSLMITLSAWINGSVYQSVWAFGFTGDITPTGPLFWSSRSNVDIWGTVIFLQIVSSTSNVCGILLAKSKSSVFVLCTDSAQRNLGEEFYTRNQDSMYGECPIQLVHIPCKYCRKSDYRRQAILRARCPACRDCTRLHERESVRVSSTVSP